MLKDFNRLYKLLSQRIKMEIKITEEKTILNGVGTVTNPDEKKDVEKLKEKPNGK